MEEEEEDQNAGRQDVKETVKGPQEETFDVDSIEVPAQPELAIKDPSAAPSNPESSFEPEPTLKPAPVSSLGAEKPSTVVSMPTKKLMNQSAFPSQAAIWSDARSRVHPLFRNGAPTLSSSSFSSPITAQSNASVASGYQSLGPPSVWAQMQAQVGVQASFEQRAAMARSRFRVQRPEIPTGSATVGHRDHYNPIIPSLSQDVVSGCTHTTGISVRAAAQVTPIKMMRRSSTPDIFASRSFFDVDDTHTKSQGENDSFTALLDDLHDDIEPLPMDCPTMSDCFAPTDATDLLGM